MVRSGSSIVNATDGRPVQKIVPPRIEIARSLRIFPWNFSGTGFSSDPVVGTRIRERSTQSSSRERYGGRIKCCTQRARYFGRVAWILTLGDTDTDGCGCSRKAKRKQHERRGSTSSNSNRETGTGFNAWNRRGEDWQQPNQFGWSVSTDGRRIMVGRIDEADGPAEAGRAWLIESKKNVRTASAVIPGDVDHTK